jgi:hypothetical protein
MLVALRERGVVLEYDKVDISGSDELFQRYGLLIPVLQDPQGEELLWPFDAADLGRFIARE